MPDSVNPDPDDTSYDQTDQREADEAYGKRLLAELYGADGPPDLETFAGPLHWAAIRAVDLAQELHELRSWVEELLERFPHLDHTVIPSCWWQHTSHIEALQALRDHERVSYADTSPGTAAVDWHRALLLIECRLRDWTAWCGCASGHRDPIRRLRLLEETEWQGHVLAEVERRQAREIDSAM
jgi:hypothetical protein